MTTATPYTILQYLEFVYGCTRCEINHRCSDIAVKHHVAGFCPTIKVAGNGVYFRIVYRDNRIRAGEINLEGIRAGQCGRHVTVAFGLFECPVLRSTLNIISTSSFAVIISVPSATIVNHLKPIGGVGA